MSAANEWDFRYFTNECENPVQSVFHDVICLFYTYRGSAILKKYIPALAKFELYEQLEYTENIILSKLPEKATRNDRENTIRLNYGLWLDETIFSRVRNSFRLSDWSKQNPKRFFKQQYLMRKSQHIK